LDGLRALAVAGVFLYHANVSWVPGGFLGVDLFFVLSGYLITSLLLEERAATGRIDLLSFWKRRARRLFPAVLVVIVFTLLAASTLARDDLARTRADALSAFVYLTNWREIIASHSYFNEFGRPSLLLHLWSLAVEEQFYLFWPLILIAGLRRLGRSRTLLLTILLTVASCALMWVLHDPSGDPSRIYYGTDTRAYTLLIGALLAFVWPFGRLSTPAPRRIVRTLEAVGVLTLAGVLALFWRVHDYDPWIYRGGLLLMALCAAGLVAAVVHPATALGKLLGARPLRWIGARSYGIYLWHWPIMQLTRPTVDVAWHGPMLIVAQAIATVVAAALSYRYVEMPVRSGAAQRRLRVWIDRYAPRQRLGWAAGAVGGAAVILGLGFGIPAPQSVAAVSSDATRAALAPIKPHKPVLALAPRPDTPVPRVVTVSAVTTPKTTTSHKSAQPKTQKPGALPGGHILALGDSVMLGCEDNLEDALEHRVTVDAIVGRQAEDTIDRIAAYRAEGQLPDTVVVQIGDNGPVWYADLQHLRQVLKGVPRVVLVNVRLARSWQNEVNTQLAQYVRNWPQAVIANWYGASNQGMLVDGVHPSVSAREVYTHVVTDALRTVQAKSTAAGS
jgi:peptidoglycan/LPS O-acetylase OafA/YrhL